MRRHDELAGVIPHRVLDEIFQLELILRRERVFRLVEEIQRAVMHFLNEISKRGLSVRPLLHVPYEIFSDERRLSKTFLPKIR